MLVTCQYIYKVYDFSSQTYSPTPASPPTKKILYETLIESIIHTIIVHLILMTIMYSQCQINQL